MGLEPRPGVPLEDLPALEEYAHRGNLRKVNRGFLTAADKADQAEYEDDQITAGTSGYGGKD